MGATYAAREAISDSLDRYTSKSMYTFIRFELDESQKYCQGQVKIMIVWLNNRLKL